MGYFFGLIVTAEPPEDSSTHPQHCCSALKWAPIPRIDCDLLVLTNRVRIADKAVTLYSPGLPAATLPQRGGPSRLGVVSAIETCLQHHGLRPGNCYHGGLPVLPCNAMWGNCDNRSHSHQKIQLGTM